MDHPPIPPGCPELSFTEGDTLLIHMGGDFFFPDRKVIAAVAEVAWLKEAEFYAGQSDISWEGGESTAEDFLLLMESAKANARAWREWGEK